MRNGDFQCYRDLARAVLLHAFKDYRNPAIANSYYGPDDIYVSKAEVKNFVSSGAFGMWTEYCFPNIDTKELRARFLKAMEITRIERR